MAFVSPVSLYCVSLISIGISLSLSLSQPTVAANHHQYHATFITNHHSFIASQRIGSQSTRSSYKPYAVNVQRSATLPANSSLKWTPSDPIQTDPNRSQIPDARSQAWQCSWSREPQVSSPNETKAMQTDTDILREQKKREQLQLEWQLQLLS